MADNTGLPPGVEVTTDFVNPPPITPEEKELLSLSEEELQKRVETERLKDSQPPSPSPVIPPIIETQEPLQAQPPQVPVKPVEVKQPALIIPPKFQKPDGTLDEAKLDKSVEAIKAKLSDYLNAEKELTHLRQKQNQIPMETGGQIQPSSQDSFLQKFKEDFANNPEETILKLASAVEMGTKTAVMGEIEELKKLLTLKDLAASNPDMLTQTTLNELKQIRTERPHLTWEDALEIQRGRIAMKSQNKGSEISTQPKPTAPILPGGIAPSILPASPSGVTLEKVNDLLKGKTPKEQEDILAKILPHK